MLAQVKKRDAEIQEVDMKWNDLDSLEDKFKMLSIVNPLPPMTYWTYTPQNVLVEDENELHHVPYISDALTDINSELIKHLSEKYTLKNPEENVKNLSDELLVKLVDAMMMENNSQEPVPSTSTACIAVSNQVDTPDSIIFHAVSIVFGNETPEKLKDRYWASKNKAIEIAPEKPKNSDDWDAALALQSYHKKFCTRCFTYCCLLHDPEIVEKSGPKLNKRLGPKLEENEEPCGSNCYKIGNQKLENATECGKSIKFDVILNFGIQNKISYILQENLI